MDCPEGVAGQQRTAEAADDARRRVEERSSSGVKWYPTVHRALEDYFATRSRWESPRALPLSSRDDGDGTPSLGADSPSRRTFGLVGAVIGVVERAERRRAEAAPIGDWLTQHYERGRSYETIAEWTNGRWTHHQVERRMVAAHRAIAERLARIGIIPERAS